MRREGAVEAELETLKSEADEEPTDEGATDPDVEAELEELKEQEATDAAAVTDDSTTETEE
jgi:hypothetical protein